MTMTTSTPLTQAFEYYVAHQDELLKQYAGKVIAIKDDQVLGAYDDELTAVRETHRSHKLGTFLVQRVTPGDADYTQTFHSRVAF
jgi:hypothetical protein